MNNAKNALAESLRKLGDASKYDEQGMVFLKETGSTLEVIETVPQKAPQWAKDEEKHGIQYACKISNARGSYSFDFWGSIADAEKIEDAMHETDSHRFFRASKYLEEKTGKKLMRFSQKRNETAMREAVKPSAYAVLTALHDSAGESFADFCASYGYDEDSRTAERVYHAVMEQERNMRRLYTHDELEALQEIA